MIAPDHSPPPPRLDEPWERLPWLTPSALLLWGILLMGFTLLLQSAARPPQSIERLDARLIEILAPAAAPGGLQGAPQAEAAPPVPAAASPPPPKPLVERKPQTAPAARPKDRKPALPTVYDAHGTHTAPPPVVEGAPGEPATADGGSVAGASVGAGHSSAGGLGSDSIGARAIYAPVPKIPDELREEVMQAVAVAHFQVTYNGTATVILVRPTTNPRLNALLLDTLQQWRFVPAIRGGVAIDSAFDVRIPIAVE